MEAWVPLIVAVVAGSASVGVAFWNGRGESAELRQIKAMNEAISGLEPAARGTRALISARDQLLVRVSERVLMAPVRRAVARSMAVITAAFAGVFLALFLLSSRMPAEVSQTLTLVLSILLGVAIAIVGIMIGNRVGYQLGVSKTERKEIEALMSGW